MTERWTCGHHAGAACASVFVNWLRRRPTGRRGRAAAQRTGDGQRCRQQAVAGSDDPAGKAWGVCGSSDLPSPLGHCWMRRTGNSKPPAAAVASAFPGGLVPVGGWGGNEGPTEPPALATSHPSWLCLFHLKRHRHVGNVVSSSGGGYNCPGMRPGVPGRNFVEVRLRQKQEV